MIREAKRRRRDLDISELVEKGSRILRHEGFDALSMRRLADECSVTPMAIYHHVAGKDELLKLILNDVLSDLVSVEVFGTPDEQLVSFSYELYCLMMSNPGVGRLWTTRGIIVPNMGLVTERFFRSLDAAEMHDEQAPQALDAIVMYIAGGVSYNLSRPPGVRQGLLEDIDESDAPRLHQLIDVYADREPDAQFRWGLERLWQGIKNDRF